LQLGTTVVGKRKEIGKVAKKEGREKKDLGNSDMSEGVRETKRPTMLSPPSDVGRRRRGKRTEGEKERDVLLGKSDENLKKAQKRKKIPTGGGGCAKNELRHLPKGDGKTKKDT